MKWKPLTAATVLVVLVLTVGGILIGQVIPGVVGAGIVSAIAATGGIVSGYVPIFQDRAELRRTELRQAASERAAAEAGLKSASEPELEMPQTGPSLLLRPEPAVVKFTGRLAELADLRVWCTLDHRRSVRLIVGSGGVGKTSWHCG